MLRPLDQHGVAEIARHERSDQLEIAGPMRDARRQAEWSEDIIVAAGQHIDLNERVVDQFVEIDGIVRLGQAMIGP